MPPDSPLTASAARELLRYDRAVFEKFYRRVRRVPKRGAFAQREIGHQSYFETLAHVLNVHDAWLNYIVPGRTREFLRIHAEARRHPTDWAGFEPYRAQVWEGVERFAAGASDRSLRRIVKAPWMPGRYTAGDAVLQVTVEQAHHLGEIIGAFWQEDREPPTMTWIENFRPPRRRRRRA